MIERYSRPEMSNIWSDKSKYDLWLMVELKVCEVQAGLGLIPKVAYKAIKERAGYDIKRVAQIEENVRHDVIAFLSAVAEDIGPESRYIHMGMTSSDLLDTTFALQLKMAGKILLKDIDELMLALKEKAFQYKKTPMIGRTHGVHAEPITCGLKFALWFDEFARHKLRLESAVDEAAVGKISGAVGTFAHLSPKVESAVLKELGLKRPNISTQVVDRDRHAHFFAVLACIAASIERVATEIRHLSRTEVGEMAETFGKSQKGSSAMPHKRNPVLCENISGLARIIRANSMAAFENVVLWHERDISHSSVERIIAPDSTMLLDFMLARLHFVIKGLDVREKRMLQNLNSSHGLYNSQEVLLELINKGLTREEAYKLVQEAAMQSWREEKPFVEVLKSNAKIVKLIPAKDLQKLFDIEKHMMHVDGIFKNVFGRS